MMKNSKPEPQIDAVDWHILKELQEHARLSYSEIGRRVGLTSPAVAERVKKLEERGILLGYHARLDPEKVGRGIRAFLKLSTHARHYPAVLELAEKRAEIIECHHLTGEASFLMKVNASSIQVLDELIGQLGAYGETATSIILSSPLKRKNL